MDKQTKKYTNHKVIDTPIANRPKYNVQIDKQMSNRVTKQYPAIPLKLGFEVFRRSQNDRYHTDFF